MALTMTDPRPASLVLLPGLEGTGTTFQKFVEQRPEIRDVQVIGYPTHRPASYDELLNLILEQLPTDRSYFLLGESFSGPLAVRVAAQHPTGLKGVILCASFVRSPTAWYIRWWPGLFSTTVVRLLIQLEAAAMRSVHGRRKIRLDQPENSPVPTACPHVIAARVRETMKVDVTQELQTTKLPLLYLATNWDLVVPQRSRALIQRLRPDAEFRTLAGPHAILQNRPREAWDVVESWCSRQESLLESLVATL